MLLAFLKSVI